MKKKLLTLVATTAITVLSPITTIASIDISQQNSNFGSGSIEFNHTDSPQTRTPTQWSNNLNFSYGNMHGVWSHILSPGNTGVIGSRVRATTTGTEGRAWVEDGLGNRREGPWRRAGNVANTTHTSQIEAGATIRGTNRAGWNIRMAQ